MASEKIVKELPGFQQAVKGFQRTKTAHEHWKWITLYVRKERARQEFAQGHAASQWQEEPEESPETSRKPIQHLLFAVPHSF